MHSLVFGDTHLPDRALRVTFDGWIARVGPTHRVARLPEREYCPVVGVLAGATPTMEAMLTIVPRSRTTKPGAAA